MGRLPALNVTAAERAELSSLASRRKTAQALALRARIVLACAEGGENKAVAEEMGLDRQTVGKWRRRFLDRRMDGECRKFRVKGFLLRFKEISHGPTQSPLYSWRRP